MWTRETKELKEGYYWYRSIWTNCEGDEVIDVSPISVEPAKNLDYPDSMQIGDDCCGPSLYPKDMERGNAWIWNIPIKPPKFDS